MTLGSRFPGADYPGLVRDLTDLLESARRAAARAVNEVMTATYWEIGRRIVEHEQGGARRAAYGRELIKRLSRDLTAKFGRGFGPVNLSQMKRFYLTSPVARILQTVSDNSSKGSSAVGSQEPHLSILQTLSEESKSSTGNPKTPDALSRLRTTALNFPLPWSHYARLMSVKNARARAFYEAGALRGGWSVRQLDRQIASQYYERSALSKGKASKLTRSSRPKPGDTIDVDKEVRDPLVLEFLGLKDEYSESALEEALVRHLESFLLELGGQFAFIGRQRRLRIGDEWYRIDLLFFHRGLRCLMVIDIKVGKFTHADAGQMHVYLNYARENWVQPGENPPVGLILCSERNDALARYALEGLPNKVLAREYRLALPDEKRLVAEIERTRQRLEASRDGGRPRGGRG